MPHNAVAANFLLDLFKVIGLQTGNGFFPTDFLPGVH